MHPSSLSEHELLKDCDIRSDRRGGPGGQHRNKVATAIVILHRPTGILAEASERRSQADNRRAALVRLRLALATRHRTSVSASRPSDLWRSRVHGRRLAVSAEHVDFPSLLAELLDQLHVLDYALPEAAQYFDVASSQLVKLLRLWPPAFSQVNAARDDRSLHRLS